MKIVCDSHTKRNTVIKAIRHVMLDYDIKNVDIVSKVGQTEQSVSNLLNPNYRSDSSMTIDQLAKICDAINCDLVIDIVRRDQDKL